MATLPCCEGMDMQQLALWGNFRSANDKWVGQLVPGLWFVMPASSGRFVSTFSCLSTYQVGATACAVLHTPEPWVCAGLFSPKWWGHRDWLCCQSCLDPHPSPARTGFSNSGLTQVVAIPRGGCIGSWPTCLMQVSLVSWWGCFCPACWSERGVHQVDSWCWY